MIVFALVAVGSLVAAGALHTYWAVGGTWPGSDRTDLARKVVGATDEFPSAAMTFGVAVLLLGAALVVGGAAGLWTLPFPSRLVGAAAWIVVVVLVIRGIAGLVISAIREAKGRSTPFTRRDLRIYSPLTLTMGVFTAAALVVNV